ncbi:hypothetical protein RJT34_33358 [Clitoria ternatea]|uniref:Uncharacterized protein n=1 Tax=Clitoria ternatea TaxID=43366 RepID=A0AAN9I6R5_CLITE
MGIAGKVGDYAFKAFTATLGLATIYLTATFSVNVYRGLTWHNAQSVLSLSLSLSLSSFFLISELLTFCYFYDKEGLEFLFVAWFYKIDKQDAEEQAP